jgi:hypothetical protein
MENEKTTLKNIENLQNNTLRYSNECLSDVIEYLEYLLETLLIAFHNEGEPLPIKDVPNNPKLFAYITTARAFSIAKIALDITIRGYPLEGISLARTLAELTKCTEYLLAHKELIGKFLHGGMDVSDVLKKAKQESQQEKYLFGRLHGMRSKFAHSTPELLVLPLISEDRKNISVELVMNDMGLNRSAAIDILSQLLLQYFFFRSIFLGELNPSIKLKNRDRKIFDPEKLNQFTNLEPIQIEQIKDVLDFLTRDNSDHGSIPNTSA